MAGLLCFVLALLETSAKLVIKAGQDFLFSTFSEQQSCKANQQKILEKKFFSQEIKYF